MCIKIETSHWGATVDGGKLSSRCFAQRRPPATLPYVAASWEEGGGGGRCPVRKGRTLGNAALGSPSMRPYVPGVSCRSGSSPPNAPCSCSILVLQAAAAVAPFRFGSSFLSVLGSILLPSFYLFLFLRVTYGITEFCNLFTHWDLIDCMHFTQEPCHRRETKLVCTTGSS